MVQDGHNLLSENLDTALLRQFWLYGPLNCGDV
jgi:hypothetical protein